MTLSPAWRVLLGLADVSNDNYGSVWMIRRKRT